MAALENIASSLQGKIPPHLQESSIQALEPLQDIFNQTASPPPTTQPTSKVVIIQEIQDTEGQEDHTPIPPVHPPTQRPAPPPRVEPPIKRIVPPPRLDPPPPPRVQPLLRSKILATATLPRVTPAPRTNGRENQTQSSAHNTQSKTRLRSSIHKAMLPCAHVTQYSLAPANCARWKFPMQMLNAVLGEDTGELMVMIQLMKNTKYRELWRNLYGN